MKLDQATLARFRHVLARCPVAQRTGACGATVAQIRLRHRLPLPAERYEVFYPADEAKLFPVQEFCAEVAKDYLRELDDGRPGCLAVDAYFVEAAGNWRLVVQADSAEFQPIGGRQVS